MSFLEPEDKVGYHWGRDSAEQETMDYLEFIARVTSHIPDKGQVMVRYYGLYANAHRGKVKKRCPSTLRVVKNDLKRIPSKGWAEMIWKVYEVDPMVCPQCGGRNRRLGRIGFFSFAFAALKSIRGREYPFSRGEMPIPCLTRRIISLPEKSNS